MAKITYKYDPYKKNSYVAIIREGGITAIGISSVSYAEAKERVILELQKERHMVAINKTQGGVVPPSEEINI